MNVPPTDGQRVPVEALRGLVRDIYLAVPIPAAHASLVANLLIDTELRGVVSHGVMQMKRYVGSYQACRMNREPRIRVLHEGPVTAALTGDGGLGMIVATQAMQMAIAKAKALGVGVVTTTYHDHLGSSGKYVRMALREGLLGISLSGRNAAPSYSLQETIVGSIQGSPPLAFGMPGSAGRPDFLLDLASHTDWDEECFRKIPTMYIKAIGFSHVANILSGTLGGQMLPEFDRRNVPFQGADQSGFHMALEITRFTSLDAFEADIDHLMDQSSRMQPLPGFTESSLPGGRAWVKEQDYLANGIPVGGRALADLQDLAGQFGLAVPWK